MGSEFKAKIIDTDYDSFMLTYMCFSLPENKKLEKWGVAVRDPDASEEEQKRILDLVTGKMKESQGAFAPENMYTFEDLVAVKQGRSQCQYYGEEASGGQ